MELSKADLPSHIPEQVREAMIATYRNEMRKLEKEPKKKQLVKHGSDK